MSSTTPLLSSPAIQCHCSHSLDWPTHSTVRPICSQLEAGPAVSLLQPGAWGEGGRRCRPRRWRLSCFYCMRAAASGSRGSHGFNSQIFQIKTKSVFSKDTWADNGKRDDKLLERPVSGHSSAATLVSTASLVLSPKESTRESTRHYFPRTVDRGLC